MRNYTKRVVFFIHNVWAFGSIHHALCKELFQHGVYAHVLNWSVPYQRNELQLMCDTVDYFVTVPSAAQFLNRDYGVPFSKMILIGHGRADYVQCDTSVYDQIHKYAVVCPWLVNYSKDVGISRTPSIVRVGIHVANFEDKVHDSLNVVGYAASRKVVVTPNELDIKRGDLLEYAVSQIPGVTLKQSEFYHYITMPGFYKQIDALVMTSSEETVGLPIMEASAAGRLVIGTPVGYFGVHGFKGAGIVAPIERQAFLDKVILEIDHYHRYPSQYKEVCHLIQDYARANYDWSNVIEDWVQLLS